MSQMLKELKELTLLEFRKMNWEERLTTVLKMDTVPKEIKNFMSGQSMQWKCCSVGERFANYTAWKEANISEKWNLLIDNRILRDLGNSRFPNAVRNAKYEEALRIHRRIQKAQVSDEMWGRLGK